MKLVKSARDSLNDSSAMLKILPKYRHWYEEMEGRVAQVEMTLLESYSRLVPAYLSYL